MLTSLSVIFLLAIVLYILGKEYTLRMHNGVLVENRSNTPIVVSVLLFAVICGLRCGFGVDNLSYIKNYLYVQQHGHVLREDFEPLFAFIQMAMAKMGIHYTFFNGFWAAAELGLIYYALRKEKYLLAFVALYIVLGPVMLHWTNGVRQCVAGCIFIVSIEYVVKRQVWKYLIAIAIAYTIHKSALLLFPLYFVYRIPSFLTKRWITIGILIICVILGDTPFWIKSISNITDLLTFMDYDKYADKLSDIANENAVMAWGPRKLGLLISYIFVLWYFPDILHKWKLNIRYKLYFFYFFIGCCAFFLFTNTSHILLRPVYYMLDFRIIMVPLTIYFLFRQKFVACFLILSVLAYFYTPLSTVIAFINGEGLSSFDVYKFFFDYPYPINV